MHKFDLKSCKAAVALALSAVLIAGSVPVNYVLAASNKTTDKTANEVVADMTVGFNIGNTLDAFGEKSNFPLKASNETGWGNPEISSELIEAIGAGGFNTVRLPVSWGQYTVGDDYEIPGFIMKRVKEVVNYCIDNDMYVILNSHHDINDKFDFYYPNNKNKERSEKYFESIWTQIAKEFKDYDSHLVFETMNEPRLVGHNDEWWFPRQNPSNDVLEAVACINDYNQVALDAIRKTGGNNATRCVMVPGYDASCDGAMISQFKLPKDSANDRLIVSVHAYTPYSFALEGNGTSTFNGQSDIDSLFRDLDSKFLSKGTPVVIGETSATNRNNTAERAKWADYFWGAASEYNNVAMCIWDNNVLTDANNPGECHRYINRMTFEWSHPEVIKAIMSHVDGTPAKSAGNSGNSGNAGNNGGSTPTTNTGRAGEIVRDMTAGWNLGNSLDTVVDQSNYPCKTSQETMWGNPLTTKAMIDEVAKAGFNTVRVPVSWGQYTTGSDYKIPAWFMSRVKEVVDYAIANDMYVILDTHHDIGDKCRFFYPDDNHRDESIKFLTSVWTQISNAFKNYDDKLLFETMNEPRLVGDSAEWWFPRANPGDKVIEAVKCINDYNQASLDAIRKTGGKNADRCVIVCGYDTSADGVMVSDFALPKDTVENRVIVAVHAYTPYYFALCADNQKIEKFDDCNKDEIDSLFYDLNKKFVKKGVPVIITETGCLDRGNNKNERLKWTNYFWGAASKITDCSLVLWDNNVFTSPSDNLGSLNRTTLKWSDTDFINTIMKYVDGTPAKVNGSVKPSTEVPTTVAPTTVAPTTVAPTTVAPTTVPPTTEVPTTVAPTKDDSTSSSNGVKVNTLLNDWGSGFQYIVEVKNEGAKVDTWTVMVKKADINITSSWCVNIEEVGDYYVITPMFWNSVLEKGQSISFGVQGDKRASVVNFSVK